MIEDMNARKLCAGTQRGHIRACKRFAAFLKRSPETASLEDIRRFQLHLAEAGVSICTRNVIMTGLRFLFRVRLRRLDLAAEMYHLRAPQKIPLVISTDEAKRLLAVADSLKTRVMLSLSYGCGLRAGEVVRLKVKHIDSAQKIIRGFRRLLLEKLAAAHAAGELRFFGNHAELAHAKAFAAYLAPLRKSEWVVYSKHPWAGLRKCCVISPAIPTASPSRTAA
jgi:integrase